MSLKTPSRHMICLLHFPQDSGEGGNMRSSDEAVIYLYIRSIQISSPALLRCNLSVVSRQQGSAVYSARVDAAQCAL
jgi:hypothetical protein